MHRGLLGRKLGTSSLFSPEGHHVPVTVLQVGPCVVTQVKKQAVDGYDALQVGFVEKRSERINRPLQGHFKKSGGQGYAFYPIGHGSPEDVRQGLGDRQDTACCRIK